MPFKKNILWQIYPQFLLLILLSLLAVTFVATRSLKQLNIDRTAVDLEARCDLLSQLLFKNETDINRKSLNPQINALSEMLKTRITVILPDGRIAADSDENYQQMDNHADRPEIRKALQGQTGIISRHSYTLNKEMLYVARPVILNGRIVAVLRTSMPSASIENILNRFHISMLMTGFIVILGAGLIGFIYTWFLNKPVQQLKLGAARMGSGEFSEPVYIQKPEEFRILADALNQMAGQLRNRIEIITKQRNELEAMLSSMVEAVLVVDSNEMIIRMNHALSALFNIDAEKSIGRPFQECIRNVDLHHFIRLTLHSRQPQVQEFELRTAGNHVVQAHGTVIQNDDQKITGVLIVLYDITQQKNLERIRKEFVANVSHELKTPVTAIHGFVETLREGALHDKHKAMEFLEIINRHTLRLDSIIEDLLNLSRIEQDAEKKNIPFQMENLILILNEAVDTCSIKAAEKHMTIKMNVSPDLTAEVNAALICQAFINLIDNAVKYSPENSEIRIQGFQEIDRIVIEIIDHGLGIPPKDIPRIFERFYRVDKARSRKLGGTGLGLAIVKHIIQMHQGRIEVESQPDQGSLFRVILNSPEH